MRVRNEQTYSEKKVQIMEKCYECYAKNGLHGTGIATLAEAAKISKASFYLYFKDIDDLIVQSTEYCMTKVEDEFMEKAPANPEDINRFIDEIPEWTAAKHGKKYRLMYQVYTHPKYIEYGKKFFEGVEKRYTEYAKMLEPKLGVSYTIILSLIFIFVRASVHYAMFEDKYYMLSQMSIIKEAVKMFIKKNK